MSNLMEDLLDFVGSLATRISGRDGYIKGKSSRMIASLPPLPKPPVMAKAMSNSKGN
jgi:hypothetical protein